MDSNRFSNLVPQSLLDAVTEALKGGQKKLDVDGDGKLEKSDFEKLRKNKKPEAGETKSQEKKEHTGPCSADCGCMKEGAKEDKPPFDPPYNTPGTRKDEYGNKIKNVAKHLARKAMKANEEVEELDEISAKTAVNAYAKRNAKAFNDGQYDDEAEKDYNKLDKQMGRIRRKFGQKTLMKASGAAHKAIFGEEVELSEEHVLIHAPGNKHHGKKARVFHKHDDGRINVQLKHSSKKGDVSNFTLQPQQFTPTEVKEEAEIIREISAKAVDSYREKAYAQQPAGDDGSQLYKKRKAGRDMAFKKVTHGAKVMAKEGAEQISELSNKVLKSYIKKASNQAFSKGYSGGAMTVRGDMNRDSEEEKAGEKNVHKAIKRVSGISKAVDKLKTEAATPGVAAGSLPNGEHMCATNIMHKEWKEGQPVPTMHAEPDANGLIEWYDVMFEHGIERVNTADIEILEACSHSHKKMKKEEVELDEATGSIRTASNKAEKSRQRALKKAAAAYRQHGDMNRAIKDHDLFTKDADKIREMQKEEVEHPNCGNPECCGECDTAELSQEELDFVASLNSTELDEKHTVKYALKNPAMGGKISAAHYDSKEDAEKFLQSVKKKGGNGVVSSVKEEVELDEARGRGRPSAASKALEDEPLALGMQLRKAKSINKPVTFANKETKQVTGAQIASFNDHMAACRTTQEKAAFQKKCFASYDAFAKAVAVKAGDKPKDTGEVIKYGQ